MKCILLGPIRGYTNAEWVLTEMDVTVPLVSNEAVLEKKTQPCLDPPKTKRDDGQRDEKNVLRKMQATKLCYEVVLVFGRDARLGAQNSPLAT